MTDRTAFIGGSDAAAIVGLSPFKDAETLLLEKAGLKAPDDSRFEGHRTWGSLIEPLVREYTAKELGCAIITRNGHSSLRHPEHSFLCGEVDGLILDDKGHSVGVYEGKTTAYSMKKKWKDAPPPDYRIQVVHYMLVGGFKYAVIAVLIGGNDYRMFRIERDEEECQLLLELELRFWKRVCELRKEVAA